MLVIPLTDPGLGNTSYLVDLGDGSALMVDPERDPRPYLQAATRHRLVIRHVAETHLHADFISGARELVALGAELIAPRESNLAHPYRPVTDGDELSLGDLVLRVLATPGHTPEHVAYVLSEGTTPKEVFTGGTLMVGGVARPDLISPEMTGSLARDAHRSVRRLLEELPGEVTVRPTHGAGSFCAAGPAARATASTVSDERASHPAALEPDPSVFAEALLAGLGSYPTYFRRLRPVNQEGPEVHGVDLPELADTTSAPTDGRTVVVDARPIERYASAHIPGSISIELRDQFGTWLGWLFGPDTPLMFAIDADQDERELVRQALNVGHRALAGRISVGQWIEKGGVPDTIELLPPTRIGSDATIVDVRQRSEWEAGHVPGAIHVELADLLDGATPLRGEVVAHCGHGQRAMTAAGLLRRAGLTTVAVTTAGPADISEAGRR